MANRIFNIEKFQTFWDSLSAEQRSPGDTDIKLLFAEGGTRMVLAGKESSPVVLPWIFGSDGDGANLLFQMLQQMGVVTGALEDYLMDDIEEPDEAFAAQASETIADSTAAQDPDTQWVPYEPEDSTAQQIGVAVLKAMALVGGGYIAYRMGRRGHGTIRYL